MSVVRGMGEALCPQEIEVPGFQSGILMSLYELWRGGQFCDAVIHTATGTVEAHRAVLCAASPYIQDIASHDSPQYRISHYHLPVARLEDVMALLRLFYTGRLTVSTENVASLIDLSVFLQVEKAAHVCQRFYNGWHSQKERSVPSIHGGYYTPECKDFHRRETLPTEKMESSDGVQDYSISRNSNTPTSTVNESASESKVLRPNQSAVNMQSATYLRGTIQGGHKSAIQEFQRSATIAEEEFKDQGSPVEGDEDKEELSPRSTPSDLDKYSVRSGSDNESDGRGTDNTEQSPSADSPDSRVGPEKTSTISPGIRKFGRTNTRPSTTSKNLLTNSLSMHCDDCNETFESITGLVGHKKLHHPQVSKGPTSPDNATTAAANSSDTVTEIKSEKTSDNMENNVKNSTDKHQSGLKTLKKKGLRKRKPATSKKKKYSNSMKIRLHKIHEVSKVVKRSSRKSGRVTKEWPCTICNIVFNARSDREHHRRLVHVRMPRSYKCVECKLIFSLAELKTHVEATHPERVRCTKCEHHPTFSTYSQLQKHRRAEHFTDSTRCVICREIFRTKEARREHLNTVHPTGMTCPECNTKFDYWKNLIDHRNHKHKVPYQTHLYKTYSCDIEGCKYQTVETSRFQTHKREVHCESRSHACDECQAKFKSKRALKAHNATHMDPDQRPGFQCDQCGKKFVSGNYLKIHIAFMHGKEKKTIVKPFLCHLCPYRFRDKNFFHSHMLRVHKVPAPPELKLYRCTHCDFFTVQHSHLRKHMRHHTGDVRAYECHKCGKTFFTEHCLADHIQRHQMKDMCCTIPGCGYSTKYKNNLKNHISRMHTEKDLKPYMCPYCDYRCKEKGNLNKHITGKHKVDVMTIAKLRKNAIEAGTGYPNFITMATPSNIPGYSDGDTMGNHGDMLQGSHGYMLGGSHGDMLGVDHGNVLGGSHGDTLGDRHGDTLGGSHGDIMGGNHGDMLRRNHGNTLGGSHGDMLGGNHGDIMGGNHGDMLRRNHGDTLGGSHGDILGGSRGNLGGQLC